MIFLVNFFSGPLFHTMHGAFQVMLVGAARFLIFALTFRVPLRGRWIIRHSASMRGEFNVFFSDIDFSVVVPAMDQKQIALMKRRYYLLKKLFPWLGELEIYTEAEKARFDALSVVWARDYQRVRHFRKINWMLLAKANSRKKLEHCKYDRAIRKSLRQFGAASGEEAFRNLFSPSSSHGTEYGETFFFPYLGCWVNATEAVDPYVSYTLDSSKTLQFLALLPSAGIPADLVNKLSAYRKEPAIDAHWRAFTEMEALVVRAVNRGAKAYRADMDQWENEFWNTLDSGCSRG